MMRKYLVLVALILIVSCSKKHMPSTVDNTATAKKGPWPKTLNVDDRVAKKSVDGRLYFDLEGKRYWKNYKDNKYYLYNQSMYGNPAFKPAQHH